MPSLTDRKQISATTIAGTKIIALPVSANRKIDETGSESRSGAVRNHHRTWASATKLEYLFRIVVNRWLQFPHFPDSVLDLFKGQIREDVPVSSPQFGKGTLFLGGFRYGGELGARLPPAGNDYFLAVIQAVQNFAGVGFELGNGVGGI